MTVDNVGTSAFFLNSAVQFISCILVAFGGILGLMWAIANVPLSIAATILGAVIVLGIAFLAFLSWISAKNHWIQASPNGVD